MRRLILNCNRRMLSCGAITGAAGAAIGAGSVLCLGAALGWVAGLFASAAIGGLVIWLASKRLLADATACLAALGDEEVDHTRRHARRPPTDRYRSWGQQPLTPGSLI